MSVNSTEVANAAAKQVPVPSTVTAAPIPPATTAAPTSTPPQGETPEQKDAREKKAKDEADAAVQAANDKASAQQSPMLFMLELFALLIKAMAGGTDTAEFRDNLDTRAANAFGGKDNENYQKFTGQVKVLSSQESKDNANTMRAYLHQLDKERGTHDYSDTTIDAILANADKESGVNPLTRPGDGGKSHYMFQWNNFGSKGGEGRLDRHEADAAAFYKANGIDPNHPSMADRVRADAHFMDWELHHTHKAALDGMHAAGNDSGKAAREFALKFEGMADKVHDPAERAAKAEKITRERGV